MEVKAPLGKFIISGLMAVLCVLSASSFVHAQTMNDLKPFLQYIPPELEKYMSSESSRPAMQQSLTVPPPTNQETPPPPPVEEKPPVPTDGGGGTAQDGTVSSASSRRPPSSPPPRYPSSSSSSRASKASAASIGAATSKSASRSSRSSSWSSSSSIESTIVPTTVEPSPCEGLLSFQRECFWYSDPIMNPNAILRPSDFTPGWVNPLLALLTTFIIGLSGLLLASLAAMDAKRVRDILRRLPLQAFCALVILWLINTFIPQAHAQGLGTSGASLTLLYLYVGVFFVVVNLSNFIFNNILTSEGDKVHEFIVSHPLLDRFISEGKKLSREKWLIVVLLMAYGIIGAHISPSFSLFPQRQIGIALITTLAIILSAYFKDFVRFLLARVWKLPAWFKANVAGLFIAIACVAITRSLQLSPGYIFGVPVGLFIAAHVYEKREGLFESLGLLWLTVLALILWMCTPLLVGYPVLSDALNLFFVIAIEHAFIETFPLPYLAGGSIFRWKKIVWAVQFAIITFLLFQTLFNPKGTLVGLAQSPPALSTLFLLGCYVVGVLWLWLYIVWGRKKRA